MTKKMFLGALAVSALSAVGPSGPVAAAEDRSVSMAYERPQGLIFSEPTDGEAVVNVVLDDSAVRAKRGERALTVEIVDEAGGTPRGDVHLDFDRDGEVDVHKDICGSTTKPLRIKPGTEVSVRVYAGQCHDGSPAVATRGTIEITFQK